MASVPDLSRLIRETQSQLGRPLTVGISGYCGSGKSTLTRQLVRETSGAVRLRGDDFLDPSRSHFRSNDWDGMDRTRLVRDVLQPFQTSHAGSFRRYDWSRGELGVPEPLPLGDVLIVDAIGLFHPDSLPSLDLTVWVDVDLPAAVAQGKQRDRLLGRNHEHLWDEIWVPNEEAFTARYSPRRRAQVLYTHALSY